ncbi:MAG: glycosyltransferase family 2 protein [Gammaproteobacteria bacterium]
MEFLFWLAAFGAAYSYFIYPLVLACLPRRKLARGYRDASELPRVTLLVTAHNEVARIEAKLRNSLAVDYPRDRFEVLVASDASTDETDSIVKHFADRGVRLVRAGERLGKEHAQGLAVRQATGDILVFSDVGTEIPPQSIRRMVHNFADERVGAVSSEDRFISQDGRIAGEGLYVRYEMWLRGLESSVNSLVGLSGSFFAVRRRLCEHWDITVPSDFTCALNSVRQGCIAVTDPDAVGIYHDIKDPRQEYQRKVRTVIRGITAVARQPQVLNPMGMGLFAFQVWSHKVMRWAVPWFLACLLAVSVLLAGNGVLYATVLALQVAAYGAAVAGWLIPWARDIALLRVSYFFMQVNVAMAHAVVAFLVGKRITMWNPSAR